MLTILQAYLRLTALDRFPVPDLPIQFLCQSVGDMWWRGQHRIGGDGQVLSQAKAEANCGPLSKITLE